MRKALGVFLLLVLGAFQAQAADLRMDVSGEIGIDPQGNVFDCQIKTILTPEVKQLVDRSVRQWKFEPVLREGKPVHAKSDMRLTLLAKPVDKGYQLQVESAIFHGNRRAELGLPPPRYPMNAARAGVGGDVLVAVRVNAEGKVTDAVAVQYALPYRNVKQKDVMRWGKVFGEASTDAARQWRFQPADLAAGEEAETTLIIPVDFRLDDASDFSRYGWRSDSASPQQPIPWLSASAQKFDATGLKRGDSLALGDPIKLKTDVVGRSL